MSSPQEAPVLSDGQPLMVYDWPATDSAALSILFLHATGFHARCWDTIIRQLPDYHCYAMDTRGHGQSYKPDVPLTWQQTGVDAATVTRTLGLRGAIGVGHSMGGNSLVRAAADVPGAFSALLLIDPVIFPFDWYTLDDYSIEGHFILQRRRQWTSPEQMYERFRARVPFSSWDDQILRDYCQYALLPDGDGYTLACAPDTEAHIYLSSRLRANQNVYDAIRQINVPVYIMRCTKGLAQSGNDLLLSPTAPNLAEHFQRGKDIPLPNNTHFIPMESPQLVVEQIQAIVRENVAE
jgi:pimeloyl-ACP methyl ester carboxylesterase